MGTFQIIFYIVVPIVTIILGKLYWDKGEELKDLEAVVRVHYLPIMNIIAKNRETWEEFLRINEKGYYEKLKKFKELAVRYLSEKGKNKERESFLELYDLFHTDLSSNQRTNTREGLLHLLHILDNKEIQSIQFLIGHIKFYVPRNNPAL